MRGGRSATYTETAPDRGFHLFTRPKRKTPEAQWAYVQKLRSGGHTRAAAKQALALRLFWPYAAEAPEAQLAHARLLEERGYFFDAFDAYQYLLDHYAGQFDFSDVIASQRRLARTAMTARYGRFLFLPGFHSPERAVPLFQKIVVNAPEEEATAEDYYLMGTALERTYDYDQAIHAYFTTMNRFPGSSSAEKAAYAQAMAHIKVSNASPNDKRALDTAVAAAMLYLQRHPQQEWQSAAASDEGMDVEEYRSWRVQADRREAILRELRGLTERQATRAFELAEYYDKILKRPESARIEYQTFLDKFPNDARAETARGRLKALSSIPVLSY